MFSVSYIREKFRFRITFFIRESSRRHLAFLATLNLCVLAILSVRGNGSGKYKIKCLRSTRRHLEDAFEITPSKQTTVKNCGFIVKYQTKY